MGPAGAQGARLSPEGSGQSREDLHPCPCPGLMTVTVTGFRVPVGPPWCHMLGICSPAPSLGAKAACPALGEALSGPGYAVFWGGSARVGRTLAGDPLETQHHEPGAEPPAALGASHTGGAARTLPQETGLRSCLCSCLVSAGQPREGRFHERGAPPSAPRMGLPRCPRGIWAGVASGDCLSFQWFLAVFCLEGRV